MPKLCSTALALASSLLVAACGGMPASAPMFTQEMLPDAVKVPGGHRVARNCVGVGEITYECRAKAGTAGAFEWMFVGPKADINSRGGTQARHVLRPAGHLDGQRWLRLHRCAACGGAQWRRQHSAAAGQGQPGHRPGCDQRHGLRAARGHARRRGTCGGLPTPARWAARRSSNTRPTTCSGRPPEGAPRVDSRRTMADAPEKSFDYEAAVQACARGERYALRALYQREARWLLGVAQRIVREPQQAEDVLQDAFMQVWQHAGGFKAELGSARGWIYTIVRHRALRAVRDGGREQTMDPQDLTELADSQQQVGIESEIARPRHRQLGALPTAPGCTAPRLRGARLRRWPDARADRATVEHAAGHCEVVDPAQPGQPQGVPGAIDLRDADERDAAAAEYVLGTLGYDDQAAIAAALAHDRALQAAVYAWQDRLLALSVRAAPVNPGASLWRRIDIALNAPTPRATAPAPPWWQRLRLWQGFSAAALASSMLLSVLLLQRPEAPAGARYVAVLQSPADQSTGWVVELQGDRLRLLPTATTGATPPGSIAAVLDQARRCCCAHLTGFWCSRPKAGAATVALARRRTAATVRDHARTRRRLDNRAAGRADPLRRAQCGAVGSGAPKKVASSTRPPHPSRRRPATA